MATANESLVQAPVSQAGVADPIPPVAPENAQTVLAEAQQAANVNDPNNGPGQPPHNIAANPLFPQAIGNVNDAPLLRSLLAPGV